MKQNTSNGSFFKTVLLSVSILALSSVSAYAAKAAQTNTDPTQSTITYVPGVGYYLNGPSEKIFAEEIIPVDGWVPASIDQPHTFECPEGKTCEQKVVNELPSKGFLDDPLHKDLTDAVEKVRWESQIREQRASIMTLHSQQISLELQYDITGDSRYWFQAAELGRTIALAQLQLSSTQEQCRAAFPDFSGCGI